MQISGTSCSWRPTAVLRLILLCIWYARSFRGASTSFSEITCGFFFGSICDFMIARPPHMLPPCPRGFSPSTPPTFPKHGREVDGTLEIVPRRDRERIMIVRPRSSLRLARRPVEDGLGRLPEVIWDGLRREDDAVVPFSSCHISKHTFVTLCE